MARKNETTVSDYDAQIAALLEQRDAAAETQLEAARDACNAAAASAGTTVAELFGYRVRRPAVPKYVDPASGSTWSGRGRMPLWMKSHVEGGGDQADYLISTNGPC